MKKKVMLASLLAIGLAAGVGTQIHAQDTAYLCGGYHLSLIHILCHGMYSLAVFIYSSLYYEVSVVIFLFRKP